VIHSWLKQARVDRGVGPPDALTTDERMELAQLRKENRILKEEKEILRKAAAFFAKEGR
jgi:transposase